MVFSFPKRMSAQHVSAGDRSVDVTVIIIPFQLKGGLNGKAVVLAHGLFQVCVVAISLKFNPAFAAGDRLVLDSVSPTFYATGFSGRLRQQLDRGGVSRCPTCS